MPEARLRSWVTTEKSRGYHLEGLGSIKGYILNRVSSTWLTGEAEGPLSRQV